MQELRHSTTTIVKIGPAVNSTGITPVTNLVITTADEAEIFKHNTTATLAIGGTLSAVTNADGYYNMTLSTTDLSERGPLKVAIQDDSLILPIFQDFMVLDSNYYDTKYGSTASMRSSLTAATYTTITSFVASVAGYSTFNAASDGVSLGSATYTTVTSFHASVTGYSTFNNSSDGVSLGGATYTTNTSFHASVTGYSTFNNSSDGVSLTGATYTTVTSFQASVASYSTFAAATTAVTLTAAAVDAIHDEVVEGAVTDRQATRLILSVLTGKASGGSTTTITYRDIGDTKDRVIATVDEKGNRTAVGTRDGS